MPADAAHASDLPTVIAPDGIAIHTFALPAAEMVGVAEGRIPPGRYAIHMHLSLEQYTFVTAGSLTAISGSDTEPRVRAAQLLTGDLLLTAPGESLQFINHGPHTARVLFICAPPYPVDDNDTRLLDVHGPLSRAHTDDAVRRLRTLRDDLTRSIDARIAALDARVE